MRKLLMITTAVTIAARDLLLLTPGLVGLVRKFRRSGEDILRPLTEKLWLASILDASGTERKIMFLNWMLRGPTNLTELLGAANILRLFGADYYQEVSQDGNSYDFLYVFLAERYDESSDAMMQIGAEIDAEDLGDGPEQDAVYFVTTYIPCNRPDPSENAWSASSAFWDDATAALMSYYGSGTSEREGVGRLPGARKPPRPPRGQASGVKTIEAPQEGSKT